MWKLAVVQHPRSDTSQLLNADAEDKYQTENGKEITHSLCAEGKDTAQAKHGRNTQAEFEMEA